MSRANPKGFIVNAMGNILWVIVGLFFWHIYSVAVLSVVMFVVDLYGYFNWKKNKIGYPSG